METQIFMERINSYPGISSMVNEYGYQDILEQAAGFFSVKSSELEQFYFDGYRRMGEDVLYRYVLKCLCRNIGFYDQVYDGLEDDVSRFIFTRMVQYQILPDASFLEQMLEEEDHPCFAAEDQEVREGTVLILERGACGILEAKDRIKAGFPRLVIRADKSFTDIWEIPKLLHCIHPGYQVYLRRHNRQEGQVTYCYAVWSPKKGRQDFGGTTGREMAAADGPDGGTGAAARKNLSRKRVVAMAPYERGWSNVELIKDCGLIPYLLYKNHGREVVMAGAGGESYPYLEEYVKGIKMDFLPDGKEQTKLEYIRKNAGQIDCLILRGCYSTNINVARFYKYYNPSGKIYMGLDANSGWTDRIPWSEQSFMEMLDCCDVIAASCRSMQNHLNRKWPWKIELIPNGYYSFHPEGRAVPEFARKENIILTVARLGTPQKATDILLEAFAKIAGEVPEWNLRLVGSVEPDFEPYLETYREAHPELRERICFAGAVKERDQLFREYLKAKVFALPSVYEGGTPNVVAEALNAGYVMAVSRFDAYEDATDKGRCGMDAPVKNVDEFARILLALCRNGSLEEMSARAYRYGKTHFNMENIVAKLNEMIFQEESKCEAFL